MNMMWGSTLVSPGRFRMRHFGAVQWRLFASATPPSRAEEEYPSSNIAAGTPPHTISSSPIKSHSCLVDSNPVVHSSSTKSKKVLPRLPQVTSLEEFPPDRAQAYRRHQATVRILKIASEQLLEPPTLHLLGFTAWATMGMASLEAILMCQEWPWNDFSITSANELQCDTAKFIFWYSVEQLIPSIVWDSQNPIWIAKSLYLDPATLLRDLENLVSSNDTDPAEAASAANALLRIHLLATTRFFVAGFMMIASIVRAAGVSASAFRKYEERIRLGREPPLLLSPQESPGVVIRMCGRDSYTAEVSLQKMGLHVFPVFENPDRVQYLVWRHSEQLHRPVYWCVREGKYGSSYSWDQFPTDVSILVPSTMPGDTTRESSGQENEHPKPKLLILEADATNPQDPLALGNAALDLTLDDASQGFRRLQERFTVAHVTAPGGQSRAKPFRTLRVYLGNSLEIARTGGGHSYTLRHRKMYTKEVDVLIDSRAAVMEHILDWCRRVAGTDRRICFQTSSPEYFKSLQKILRCYGFEIFDPLDLRSLWLEQIKMHPSQDIRKGEEDNKQDATMSQNSHRNKPVDQFPPSLVDMIRDDPFLYNTWYERALPDIFSTWKDGDRSDDEKENDEAGTNQTSENKRRNNPEMLRQVAKMAKLPRLVHMPTTSETVNACEALITAGEVDATNCCAILERQEGVAALEYILQQKSDLVRGERYQEWIQDETISSIANQDEEEEDDNNNSAPSSRWLHARRNRAGGGAGLQMICTSTIYDDLFRQVRIWARMGFTSAQIQREMDMRFNEILDYSHEAQQELDVEDEGTNNKDDSQSQSKQGSNGANDIPEEADEKASVPSNTESMLKKEERDPAHADPHS